MQPLILTAEEIQALTGYSPLRPALQLAELHRRGYVRARRSPTTGAVIVERAHVEAVSRGQAAPERPKLRPALRRVA